MNVCISYNRIKNAPDPLNWPVYIFYQSKNYRTGHIFPCAARKLNYGLTYPENFKIGHLNGPRVGRAVWLCAKDSVTVSKPH